MHRPRNEDLHQRQWKLPFLPAKIASLTGIEIFLSFKHPLKFKYLPPCEGCSHLLPPQYLLCFSISTLCLLINYLITVFLCLVTLGQVKRNKTVSVSTLITVSLTVITINYNPYMTTLLILLSVLSMSINMKNLRELSQSQERFQLSKEKFICFPSKLWLRRGRGQKI